MRPKSKFLLSSSHRLTLLEARSKITQNRKKKHFRFSSSSSAKSGPVQFPSRNSSQEVARNFVGMSINFSSPCHLSHRSVLVSTCRTCPPSPSTLNAQQRLGRRGKSFRGYFRNHFSQLPSFSFQSCTTLYQTPEGLFWKWSPLVAPPPAAVC